MKPLFLVGYMAAGKTTLGRRAAQLLNVEFIDLDAYIESRYRKRISDLFAERGEEGFRDIERRMLHEVAEFDNVLVATGGGTPCFFDNMEYMRHRGVTVYLAASVQTLCRRLSHAKVKRPLVIPASRPAWGAWIEIPWSIGGLGVFDVAPRMGCVD